MRSNKIQNVDLFTQVANEHFQKHIKTKSKSALEILKAKVDWQALAAPLAEKITEHQQPKSPTGRDTFSLELIIKCFVLLSTSLRPVGIEDVFDESQLQRIGAIFAQKLSRQHSSLCLDALKKGGWQSIRRLTENDFLDFIVPNRINFTINFSQ